MHVLSGTNYEHQKVGVAKAVIEFRGAALIADEMGAATYTALAAAAIMLSGRAMLRC